ncbi:glycosyltransferase family 4 protein [Patescibacteria group bacterium]
MNILFLNEYADPHIVSGAERSMKALSKALNKKTKVYTLSPNLGSHAKDIKFPFPKKIKPGKTLTPLWFNNPIFWFYAASHIKKTIKQKRINLIHVHGKYILPAAIIAGKLTKTPVIITVRDFKFLCPLALCYTNQQKKCSWIHYIVKEIPEYLNKYTQTSIFKPFVALRLVLAKLGQNDLKWFLKQANQVIAVSPQLARIYQQAGIKKTISIYNLPPKPTKSFKVKKLKNTIISVGKLSYGKGTDTILQAAKILPTVKFILAGPKNISLKTNFPKNVQYVGQLPHNKILKLYQQASAFIINSRWPEPLSRAGLEALSFGLPIVASNRGGNQELVKNNGYLVNPDKPKEIAKTIKKLLSQDLAKLGQNSLKLLSSRFNRGQIITKHLNLYHQL